MFYTIPINTTDDASPVIAEVQLEGQTFQLLFRYNQRAGFWRCDVQNTSGTTLAAGLPVRNAGLAFNQCLYLHQGMVQGLLVAFARGDVGVDAGANELGGRVGIFYRTAVP